MESRVECSMVGIVLPWAQNRIVSTEDQRFAMFANIIKRKRFKTRL